VTVGMQALPSGLDAKAEAFERSYYCCMAERPLSGG
jgi:hypothetical protein